MAYLCLSEVTSCAEDGNLHQLFFQQTVANGEDQRCQVVAAPLAATDHEFGELRTQEVLVCARV